ncbi:MAG TPA: hypothetical protein VLF88_02795 [Candidatus Babeliales bacterium]|nr:hypothetical protein [Candidatus Babeliales bacterium]
MAQFNRSLEEAKWFARTAEQHLEGVVSPSLFFGMAHVLDRKKTRAAQKETINEAVTQIATTFDPERVEVDEERDSFFGSGTISVKGANIKFNGNNPLYDQGLPNVFVKKSKSGLSTVDLLYIPDHIDRGFSATPSMHPSVTFSELSGGEFELDLGPWAPPGFEIPLRHSERLARVVQRIGAEICSPVLRPQLEVIKNS